MKRRRTRIKKAMRKGYTIDPVLLILVECEDIKFADVFEIEELRVFRGKYHYTVPILGKLFKSFNVLVSHYRIIIRFL